MLEYIHPSTRSIVKKGWGGYEHALPVEIGDGVWICGGVTITGGVKIGSNTIIGAGSVVIKDIPDNVIAAGNPARVIRKITEKDKINLT